MRNESGRLHEGAGLGVAMERSESGLWHCHTSLRKFHGAEKTADALYDVVEIDGNAFMYGGASAMFHRLIGGTSVDAFNNANSHIGVGNGTATVARGQNALEGVSVTLQAMDSGYPEHTDGLTDGAHQAVFRATFANADANHVWAEWGIFNAGVNGRMLNRKVEALGEKTAASTWELTITLSLN